MKKVEIEAFPLELLNKLAELFDRWCDRESVLLTRPARDVLLDQNSEAEIELIERFACDLALVPEFLE